MQYNRLPLNVAKTSFEIHGNGVASDQSDFSLINKGLNLKEVSRAIFLSVIISNYLQIDEHATTRK